MKNAEISPNQIEKFLKLYRIFSIRSSPEEGGTVFQVRAVFDERIAFRIYRLGNHEKQGIEPAYFVEKISIFEQMAEQHKIFRVAI